MFNIFHFLSSLSGSENGRCVASEYFTEPDIEITTENTANILSEYNTAHWNNTWSYWVMNNWRVPLLIDCRY